MNRRQPQLKHIIPSLLVLTSRRVRALMTASLARRWPLSLGLPEPGFGDGHAGHPRGAVGDWFSVGVRMDFFICVGSHFTCQSMESINRSDPKRQDPHVLIV